MRAAIFALFLLCSAPAYAGVMEEVQRDLFEDPYANTLEIKKNLRSCKSYEDCTAVLSMCRWRPVNVRSQQAVAQISARIQAECKWPPPPAEAPKVNCQNKLCEIAPDGKFY